MIKKEIKILLTAVMFYTRIPCPVNMEYSAEMLNKSTRYLPFIGWIIGSVTGFIYWGSSFILPDTIAIILSMASGILITGAFHEDGFADVCDGFGGGWTKEDRLRIMKDSRLGTYGAIGIIFILLSKFFFLKELSSFSLLLVLVASHSVSRLIPVLVIFFGSYSRDDLTSKVKPIGRKISVPGLIVAIVTGVFPVLLFQKPEFFLIIILPILTGLLLMQYFKKRIDGYTGDCLGTIQQVSEITVYLSLLLIPALLKI